MTLKNYYCPSFWRKRNPEDVKTVRSFLCAAQRNEPKKSRPAAWPSALLAKHLIAAAARTRFAQTACRLHPHSNTLLGCAATGFKTLKAKTSMNKGCSKIFSCKARAIMRNEAYFLYVAMTNDKRNAADGCFSTAE